MSAQRAISRAAVVSPSAPNAASASASALEPVGAGATGGWESGAAEAAPTVASTAATAVVVFGTGVVGGALLQLLGTPAAASLRLVGAANSRRQQLDAAQLASRGWREQLNRRGGARDDAALLAALDASGAAHKVIVDATASALLATLSTVRRLRRCGDRLLTMEGVFSGSLSWLFNQYDGSRPFSALLREARELGYTEPDPRADLSGEDAARKLLIIARHAGFSLGADEVQLENLVPAALRALDTAGFLARLEELDAPIAARHAEAATRGNVLRFLARLNQRGLARVGLVEVSPEHPAARLSGTDNQFVLTTTRYHAQPLVIQGPGAGPEVTAQALLGDVLALE